MFKSGDYIISTHVEPNDDKDQVVVYYLNSRGDGTFDREAQTAVITEPAVIERIETLQETSGWDNIWPEIEA